MNIQSFNRFVLFQYSFHVLFFLFFQHISAFINQPSYSSLNNNILLSTSSIGTKKPHHNIISEHDEAAVVMPNKQMKILQYRKKQWLDRSLSYYSTVSRKDRRIAKGQWHPRKIHWTQHKISMTRANQLYHARQLIKLGKMDAAETIYRRLILELLDDKERPNRASSSNGSVPNHIDRRRLDVSYLQQQGDSCDVELAISTLLLALLLQRKGQVKETRKVFLQFFRDHNHHAENYKCTCSAKVLQAFALFEMKQGNTRKAYSIAELAVQMDEELAPILQWKQFRDVVPMSHSSNDDSHDMDGLHP